MSLVQRPVSQLPLEVLTEANVRLGRLEEAHGITVVYAVESGSRAWGFPSPDSDNDVRFFYIRPLSEYVRLDIPKDTIDVPISPDGLWDVAGWDLRKALGLLIKGNATVSEWLASPLIYREHGPIPYKLRDLVKLHASVERSAAHYYGLTNTCFKKDIDNRPKFSDLERANALGQTIKGLTEVNYKKYFYAIRGACAMSWIKRYHEIPPMTLPDLMSHDIVPDDVRTIVTSLLRAKATMGECGSGPRLAPVDTFIEDMLHWTKDRGLNSCAPSDDLLEGADKLLLYALGVAA